QRALDRARTFLALVTLLTVMVAAIAIALAARRFAQRHRSGMAVMRCMGASQQQLRLSLWFEFLALGVMASAVGVVAGYIAHLGLVQAAGALIDANLPMPSGLPLLHGLVAGLLLLLGFAVPPLSGLHRVPPARVLRRELAVQHPGKRMYATGLLVFFLLVWWVSGNLRLSAVVFAGFLAALLVFALAGYGVVRLVGVARRWVKGAPELRFALAGISRRQGLTVTQLCSLSLGLMVLLLLAMVRTDLLDGWRKTLPPDAPNTFIINIQPDQTEGVMAQLRQAGLASVRLLPMVRGRLVAINDQQVRVEDYDGERARRMVDREFNLSYMRDMPDSNRIVEGRWLNVSAHEISLEEGLAETLGIAVGDRLS